MKDRIRKVREQQGLNLTKFADILGVSVATVSYYESGKRIPTNAVLTAISKEFHISLAWLKTGEGPMNDPLPADSTIEKLTDVYMSLPERLKTLVDVLVSMDPEWYRTLDAAFEELERRKKRGES